ANMTVLENVLVGRHTRTREGLFSALLRGPGFKRAEAASTARAMELLEFIGLAHKADHLSRNLPYGEQRKLEIARALASDPGLLLL
ncbi:ATP-binding cassette domain-containing protein, partial [Streptomyces sp. SID11233]|nr:ATP-binding cassette domain-containing protein [Streptomyces sp. SID11233]